MAYFANIENKIVQRVIVVHDWACKTEQEGKDFIEDLGFQGEWVKTCKLGSIRGQFAGVGMFYNEVLDCFHTEKPYESWALDSKGQWNAPISRPDGFYEWNEDSKSWIEYTDE